MDQYVYLVRRRCSQVHFLSVNRCEDSWAQGNFLIPPSSDMVILGWKMRVAIAPKRVGRIYFGQSGNLKGRSVTRYISEKCLVRKACLNPSPKARMPVPTIERSIWSPQGRGENQTHPSKQGEVMTTTCLMGNIWGSMFWWEMSEACNLIKGKFPQYRGR